MSRGRLRLVEYYDRRPQAGEPRATLEALRTLAPEDQDVITDLVKAYRSARDFDKAVTLLLERTRRVWTAIAFAAAGDRDKAWELLG